MEIIYLWFALSVGFGLGWILRSCFTKARRPALHHETIDLRLDADAEAGGARRSGVAAGG